MEALNDRVFIPLTQYKIPAIKLESDTSKEAVATVFEKVNTGGLPLNVFESPTATFAGDGEYFDAHGTDFRLREDWDQTMAEIVKHPVLADFKNTDFLQAVSLLATLRRRQADVAVGKPKPSAVSARREDILGLSLDEYLEWVSKLCAALPWVAHFLAGEHFHTARDLSYGTQLVPLLTFPVVLGSDIDIHAVRGRIRQWFWCGVFGELYGSTVETKFWTRHRTGSNLGACREDSAEAQTRRHDQQSRVLRRQVAFTAHSSVRRLQRCVCAAHGAEGAVR